MANLLMLTKSLPLQHVEAGEFLIEAGESGGEMYVLEKGRLAVIRDGVQIATIAEPGALIGEMGVLLGIDHSASVKAVTPVDVRIMEGAIDFLEASPQAALQVATLVCERLEATSALLAQFKREAGKSEHGFLERLFGAVSGTTTRDTA